MRPYSFVVAVIAAIALGYGPTRTTETAHRTPPAVGVSAHDLVRSPDAFAGKRVRLLLAARQYRAQPGRIIWQDGPPHYPPLVIDCPDPPASGPLDVSGVCLGKVNGAVRVSDCTVTILPRRFP